jgi:hypothetical protein
LSEKARGFDPSESEDHRVEQGQQHLAHAVASVPLSQAYFAGYRIFEPNLGEKSMQKIRTAIVCQTPLAKRNRKFSGSSWHHGESYF